MTDTVVCWTRCKHELHRIGVRSAGKRVPKNEFNTQLNIGLVNWAVTEKYTLTRAFFSVSQTLSNTICGRTGVSTTCIYVSPYVPPHLKLHSTLAGLRFRTISSTKKPFMTFPGTSLVYTTVTSIWRVLICGRRRKILREIRWKWAFYSQRSHTTLWKVGLKFGILHERFVCVYICFIYFNDTLETRSGFVLIFFYYR